MLSNFKQVLEKALEIGQVTISVAAAADKDVLTAVKSALDVGLARAILIGDAVNIETLAIEVGLTEGIQIIHEPDIDKAAIKAVSLVKDGEANVLMKGMINSSNFLRAVLDPNVGLRSGKILSHLAALEIPGEEKIVFLTDSGMILAPDLEQKKEILINAIQTLQKMGIEKPNVAVLAANEQVNPKIQATIDAMNLVEMSHKGLLPNCVIEGPMAMDVAARREAARHKGIESSISGQVDLFLVPTIEAGNMIGKTLVHYAHAKVAGVILGATRPIVLSSRADPLESKLNSLALAVLALGKYNS